MLKIYNTPDHKVEEFTPLREGAVSLYTCGPTVYNDLTVGNWVAYIRWDTLVRTLRADGYDVTRVMNITDVGHLVSDADEGEDKMLKGAKREGVSMHDIAQRYTDNFLAGMKQLNLLMPQHLTKATDYVTEQIALVKQLEDKGYTYIIEDGVYFDTSKFPRYADFAHLDLEGQKAGARVSVVEGKRNPSDFALWKFDIENARTEMVWDSPWGRGFPGWHLECSAMAMTKLGETIDIHTGGIDHIPVHHTNEIAQSEAATGKTFARFWIHANFLMVNGTKISKSLNNGYTLEDVIAKGYTAEAYKLFILQSHYRTESNFTWENLAAAQNRLDHWRSVAVLRHQITSASVDDMPAIDTDRTAADMLAALNDDLSTPKTLTIAEQALSAFQERPIDSKAATQLQSLLNTIDSLLGLALMASTPDVADEVKSLLAERQQARKEKDWQRSDELRTRLAKSGVAVQDSNYGQRWSYTATPHS